MERRSPERDAGAEIDRDDARPEADRGDVPTGPQAPKPDHVVEEKRSDEDEPAS